MRIGIFGDSFADGVNGPRRAAPYAWYNILASKFPNVTNIGVHGVGASSLFFSYQKFLQLYHQYDLIIFCVTGATRYPKPLTLSDGQERHYCGMGAVANAYKYLGNKITSDDKRTLDHLSGYFIMNVDEYHLIASDLFINHMQSLHPNIIFYPCFLDSFTKDRFEKEGITEKHLLFHMYRKQLRLMNIDNDTEKNEKDTIIGHLVHEYNEFFANVLHKKIQTGKYDFTGYDDITSIAQPNEYYYEFL